MQKKETMDSSSWNVVTLLNWWNACDRLPLIDLRESQESGCLESSGTTAIVHLPFSTLGERSCELPPRNVQFAILCEEQHLEEAAQFFGRTMSQATNQSRKPWLVEQVMIANEELWESAKILGVWVDYATSCRSQSRLWKPDPMISKLLWPLIQSASLHMDMVADTDTLEIWDLGSGAGRDIAYLAQQIKRNGIQNIKLVGVDNHKGSADRCLPFWRHQGVSDITISLALDLNNIAVVEDAIEKIHSKRIICLYAVRFWNAKLITWLATKANLSPNTFFAMSHFCKTGPIWDFDHPKESRVLQRNELKMLFAPDWEILHDMIGLDGDHGRTMIQFVARKL